MTGEATVTNHLPGPPPPRLGISRHEARKIVRIARNLQEMVSDMLEVLTPEERRHAEGTWAGKLLTETSRKSTILPLEEAWTILDQGGG